MTGTTTLTLKRPELMAALAHLSRVVEKRTTIPILGNIRLTLDGATLTLTATDLDLEARTQLDCDPGGAESGAGAGITLPATMLADIVRKLPEVAQISLGWTAGETMATVTSGRSRFRLQALPAEDFPDLDGGTMSHQFEVPSASLARMIGKVSFAMSTEETRYYLNGFYLHATMADGVACLRAVATDGHRLARFDIPAPVGCAGMPGVIVPRKAALELARLAQAVTDKAGDGMTSLELSSHKIRATAGTTILTSKLIDGNFPDYDRVIPKNQDNSARVAREKLACAVGRVCTVAVEKGRAIKMEFGPGNLALEVSHPDHGRAEEDIEAEYEGGAVVIGFNARYLSDILSVLDTDIVQIGMTDGSSPAILKNPDDRDFLTVLMPMRV